MFILPPSMESLEARLRSRGRDTDEAIARRMRKAQDEMRHYGEYDYLICNDEFSAALSDLVAVVTGRSEDKRYVDASLPERLVVS